MKTSHVLNCTVSRINKRVFKKSVLLPSFVVGVTYCQCIKVTLRYYILVVLETISDILG